MKIAVIDIGSNSVRLMLLADGNVLYKTLRTTRLGEGLRVCSRLGKVPITRTVDAVLDFYKRAKVEGAIEVVAFATEAVRKAINKADFLTAVKAVTGLDVVVLSGDEEAEIGILGALGEKDGAILDIGGASTELIVRENGKTKYKKSVPVGVVRLFDECGRSPSLLKQYAKDAVQAFGDVPLCTSVCLIGGTATSVASSMLGLSVYDGSKVTGSTFLVQEIIDFADKLSSLTVVETTKNFPSVDEKRAEVLFGGTVWLCEILRYLGVASVWVSDADNLEGYAKKCGWIHENK